MAEEVGAAFVSLLPSARGFSRRAEAAIKRELAGDSIPIPVRPEIDRNTAFAALTSAVSSQGSADGKAYGEAFTRDAQGRLRDAQGKFVSKERQMAIAADLNPGQLRSEVRETIRVVEATRPTINVKVAIDRSLLRQLLGGGDLAKDGRSLGTQLGVAALTGLGDSTRDGIGGALSGLANNPVVSTIGIALGVALGAVLAPALFAVLGGAVAAATLAGAGLGAIFAGAFILASNPAIQKAFSSFTTRAGKVLGDAAQPLVKPLIAGLDILGDAVEAVGPQLREMFAGIAPYIPVLAEGVAGFIKAFTPGLVAAVIASGPVLEQLAWALPDLGAGLSDFLSAMASVAPQAAQFIGMLVRGLSDVIRLLGVTFQTGAQVFGFMANGFSILWSSIKYGIGLLAILGAVIVGDFGTAKVWLQDAIGDLIRALWRLWDALPAGARKGLGALVNLARGLGGRVKSAVGGLGNVLYQAGRNVVQGLIDGIWSKIGSLASAASSLAGTIRNYLPFSPAKEGPLSGSGNPFVSGQKIGDMLAGGMESRLPAVSSASSSLAGAVGFGARGSGAGAAPAQATARWVGADSDSFVRWLRENIRIDYGGDPNVAFGTG